MKNLFVSELSVNYNSRNPANLKSNNRATLRFLRKNFFFNPNSFDDLAVFFMFIIFTNILNRL